MAALGGTGFDMGKVAIVSTPIEMPVPGKRLVFRCQPAYLTNFLMRPAFCGFKVNNSPGRESRRGEVGWILRAEKKGGG
jgi:hypothetical protein